MLGEGFDVLVHRDGQACLQSIAQVPFEERPPLLVVVHAASRDRLTQIDRMPGRKTGLLSGEQFLEDGRVTGHGELPVRAS
ncbi:MAG: hypothetical protein U0840_29860 [Gemmataceae bacterium]